MRLISPREWILPVVLALLFVAMGTVPYLYAAATAPSDSVFMGFVGRDTTGANSYLAFARQAQEGATAFTNLYTATSPPHAYYNGEWWLMGKAAQWTGLSLMALFHGGRGLSVFLFVFAVYYLGAVLLPNPGTRRAALLLICCGAGLGWIPYGINFVFQTHLPISLDAGGVNIFGYLMNKPHFIRAGIFAALHYAWFIRGTQTGRYRFFCLSGLAAAGHSLIRPYHIPESVLFLLLYVLLQGGFSFTAIKERFIQAGLCALFHGPVIVWHLAIYLTNPLGLGSFDAWAPQFLLSQILWLGLPFAAVLLFGVVLLFQRPLRTSPMPVLGLWMLSAFLLLQAYPYFPWAVESYFPWIFAPPLLFIHYVWPVLARGLNTRVQFSGARPLTIALIALAVLPCSLLTYARFFTDLHHPKAPEQYYLHTDVTDALAWLRRHSTEDDVILASHDTSQFIPRIAQLRVVSGQDALTADYRQKNAHVLRFFQTPADDEGFKQWLCREQRVTYVLVGPAERALAVQEFTPFPWMTPVYENEGAVLYTVRPEGGTPNSPTIP